MRRPGFDALDRAAQAPIESLQDVSGGLTAGCLIPDQHANTACVKHKYNVFSNSPAKVPLELLK